MSLRSGFSALALVALSACSLLGLGTDAYDLDPDASAIHFIGTKNAAVAVAGTFTGLSGGVDVDTGKAWVEIPISSLATGDPGRDVNIQTHLFKIADFPIARVEIPNLGDAASIPGHGTSAIREVAAVLAIQGRKIEMTLPVRVTHEHSGLLRVTTAKPFVLTAEGLGMTDVFAVLKAVCGHASLSAAVPLLLDLAFVPAG